MNHDLNITFCINLSIKTSSEREGGGLFFKVNILKIYQHVSPSHVNEQLNNEHLHIFVFKKQNYFLSFFQQNSITLYTWNIYKRNTVHYIFFIYMLPPPSPYHFSRKIHVIIFEIVFVLFFLKHILNISLLVIFFGFQST